MEKFEEIISLIKNGEVWKLLFTLVLISIPIIRKMKVVDKASLEKDVPLIFDEYVKKVYSELIILDIDEYEQVKSFMERHRELGYIENFGSPSITNSYFTLYRQIGKISEKAFKKEFRIFVLGVEDYYWFLHNEKFKAIIKKNKDYQDSSSATLKIMFIDTIKEYVDYIFGVLSYLFIIGVLYIGMVKLNFFDESKVYKLLEANILSIYLLICVIYTIYLKLSFKSKMKMKVKRTVFKDISLSRIIKLIEETEESIKKREKEITELKSELKKNIIENSHFRNIINTVYRFTKKYLKLKFKITKLKRIKKKVKKLKKEIIF